jgi:saccharopine dehydrogenase (NAD+, L-lysine-forming)
MKHLWLRAEHRENEKRVGLTPQGATQLIKKGIKVSVEASDTRIISTKDYKDAGCEIVSAGSWENAPEDVIIFGLKELPTNDTPLKHSHIMFGHAFKGQVSGKKLLKKFKSGGGTLYDIEYLTEDTGKRVAAFGYWAGFAGAYVTLKVWISQLKKEECPPLSAFNDKRKLLKEISNEINSVKTLPSAIVIGSLGRVGTGVCDFCEELSLNIKKWDLVETSSGGPFPEVLNREILFNCVVATPNTPVFFQPNYIDSKRKLRVIGDIACDPDSYYNPIPIYSVPTTWTSPSLKIASDQPLDVMAIDNLPSLLPKESSIDFAEQLFPYLVQLFEKNYGVWQRAKQVFKSKLLEV